VNTLTLERQTALRNILFATDFEVSACRALPFAVALAKRYGAKLYAVHVIPPQAYAFASPESVDRILAEVGDFAGYTLNQLLAPLRNHGLSCESLLGEGEVAKVIEEFAQTRAGDLLVVGTSSRSALGKMFLGSVAEELIRESACPVLTVGPHVTTLASDGIRTIVCPTDFSEASKRATQFAISLADEYQAHLTLVNVLQGGPKDSLHMAIQVTEKRMREAIPDDAELTYRPEIVVETGSVADRILKLATDLSADIMVMGARGVGSFAEMVSHFGSIAHKVISLAPCPVLTVSDVQKPEKQ
jgi:nucleotide-binding universal stress UspA family protein